MVINNVRYADNKSKAHSYLVFSIYVKNAQINMASLLNVYEINSLADDQFARVFANVIELCSDAAVQVRKKGPFQSVSQLCEAFHKYLDDLNEEGK